MKIDKKKAKKESGVLFLHGRLPERGIGLRIILAEMRAPALLAALRGLCHQAAGNQHAVKAEIVHANRVLRGRLLNLAQQIPVSYTHLDVYKRQPHR